MLVRSAAVRRTVQAIAIALLLTVFALPFGAVLLGSLASSWSGALPSGITLGNFVAVFGESGTLGAVGASLATAVVATAIAIALATQPRCAHVHAAWPSRRRVRRLAGIAGTLSARRTRDVALTFERVMAG